MHLRILNEGSDIESELDLDKEITIFETSPNIIDKTIVQGDKLFSIRCTLNTPYLYIYHRSLNVCLADEVPNSAESTSGHSTLQESSSYKYVLCRKDDVSEIIDTPVSQKCTQIFSATKADFSSALKRKFSVTQKMDICLSSSPASATDESIMSTRTCPVQEDFIEAINTPILDNTMIDLNTIDTQNLFEANFLPDTESLFSQKFSDLVAPSTDDNHTNVITTESCDDSEHDDRDFSSNRYIECNLHASPNPASIQTVEPPHDRVSSYHCPTDVESSPVSLCSGSETGQASLTIGHSPNDLLTNIVPPDIRSVQVEPEIMDANAELSSTSAPCVSTIENGALSAEQLTNINESLSHYGRSNGDSDEENISPNVGLRSTTTELGCSLVSNKSGYSRVVFVLSSIAQPSTELSNLINTNSPYYELRDTISPDIDTDTLQILISSPKIKRTKKFLYAFCLGIPILDIDSLSIFLSSNLEYLSLCPTNDLLERLISHTKLNDAEGEEKYSMKIDKRPNRGIFANKHFIYYEGKVKKSSKGRPVMPVNDIEEIISLLGGTVLRRKTKEITNFISVDSYDMFESILASILSGQEIPS